MLLDEPFGALDPLTRDRLQQSFSRIRRQLGLTAIFVTHDMVEALLLGDRIAVMQAGRRMQALGMHVNLAGKIADSSVASAAIVHLGAALPQLDWDVSVTCQYLAQDIAREPLRIERGHARVPDRPGLGIEVDESRLSGLARQRLAA